MRKRLPFTNRVRELRLAHGNMTQSELGEKVGVTRQTIAAIEKGHYSPSLESAFLIARVFETDLESVFLWSDG